MTSAVGTRRTAGTAASLGAGAAVAMLLAVALSLREPSTSVAVAGGAGLVLVLTLVLWNESAAVFLAGALLAFVRVEPAPTDAVFLIVILVAAASGRLTLTRIPATVGLFLGGYLSLNLLAMTQSLSLGRSLKFSFTTFYLATFALWLTGWLTSRERMRLVLRSYLLAAGVSAFLGVGALFLPIPGRARLVYDNTRALALFKDPNVLGAFLVPAALILAEELLRPSLLRARRSTKLALFVLVVLGVLFSFSRAAWGSLVLGLLVIAGVYALRRGGGRHAFALITTMLFTGLVAVAILSATGQLTFLEQRARVQGYDQNRFGAQQYAIDLAAHHPLGIGPGQFELYSPLSAHETYLRALSEVGVLGLVLVAALLLATLVLALRNAQRGIDTYGVGSAALLGSWFGLVASGFVIDTLHWRQLWLVAAWIWAGATRGAASSTSRP